MFRPSPLTDVGGYAAARPRHTLRFVHLEEEEGPDEEEDDCDDSDPGTLGLKHHGELPQE